MHALARHTETDRNISDRRPLVHHLEHCLITQLHKPQLHQHDDDPPQIGNDNVTIEEGSAPPDADPHV